MVVNGSAGARTQRRDIVARAREATVEVHTCPTVQAAVDALANGGSDSRKEAT